MDRGQRCLGARVPMNWDWRHGAIGPIDLIPYIGGTRFRQAMNHDFRADRAGYRKIGGSANTPQSAYFFRRYANLLHLLKRQERLHLRGGLVPEPGMVVVLDWPASRGRFNFSPDRMGVLLSAHDRHLRAAMPVRAGDGWQVTEVELDLSGPIERSVMGYADLPI